MREPSVSFCLRFRGNRISTVAAVPLNQRHRAVRIVVTSLAIASTTVRCSSGQRGEETKRRLENWNHTTAINNL